MRSATVAGPVREKVRVGAEGGAQRSKEAEKHGNHRVIVHDGEIC
jgi:hypothetical protein